MTRAAEALRVAISAVGSQRAFADRLSAVSGRPVGQSVISNWLARGKIPARRVLAIVEASGGAVTAAQLAPEIFNAGGDDARHG